MKSLKRTLGPKPPWVLRSPARRTYIHLSWGWAGGRSNLKRRKSAFRLTSTPKRSRKWHMKRLAKQLAKRLVITAIDSDEMRKKAASQMPNGRPNFGNRAASHSALVPSGQSRRRTEKGDKKAVRFSPEPPAVQVIDVSVEEWRGKRRALHHIAQHVEQHRKDWMQERLAGAHAETALSGEVFAGGLGTPSSDQAGDMQGAPDGQAPLPPRPKCARWSEALSEEMDFSVPPWASGVGVRSGDSNTGSSRISTDGPTVVPKSPKRGGYRWADDSSGEMDFSIPPAVYLVATSGQDGTVGVPCLAVTHNGRMKSPDVRPTSSERAPPMKRWADGLDEEMDFSVPLQRVIGGVSPDASRPLRGPMLSTRDENGSAGHVTLPILQWPPESPKVVQDGSAGSPKAQSPTKTGAQCGGVVPTPCRSRWADEVAMKNWPPKAIPQC